MRSASITISAMWPDGDDAEPRVGWVDEHRVEIVVGDVAGDHLPPVPGELLLDDERVRRDRCGT